MKPPICLQCHVPMKCAKTGARAFECNVRQDGKAIDLSQVVAVWGCDVFACPACHMRIETGFGDTPLFEEHQTKEIENLLANPPVPDLYVTWFVSP